MNFEKLKELDGLGITEIALSNDVFESLVTSVNLDSVRIITDTIYLKLPSGFELAIRRGY